MDFKTAVILGAGIAVGFVLVGLAASAVGRGLG